MAFARPSLAELVTRVRGDLRGRLGLAPLRRAMADVLGAVWAGGVHLLHGHLDWSARQLFADTAEREGVLREAAMYGIYPVAATFASGTVAAAGVNGSAIPEGTILQRPDGFTYEVSADAEIAGGVAAVAVVAREAGAGGDLDEGEALAFESPVPGVAAGVTVASGGISGGFDEEGTEGIRARLLLRKREPPAGGADQDYRAWALSVAGVTRAWVYPNEDGLGTVAVRFVQDEGVGGIFPDPTSVAAVQAKLDEERPITAEVTAAAPTPLEVDFVISVTPDTVAVREAVEAELADLLFREAEPGDGEGRGAILLSRLFVAVGVAGGVEDFTIVSPAADVVPDVGELAVMGEIDWSP